VTPELLAAEGWGLLACAVLAALTWVASLPLRDVSIADIAWGWLVVAPGLVAAAVLAPGPRALPVLAIAVVWAVRLSLYIAARHLGQPEDHRYQAIRARNQPGFEFRSLYLVFGLQALLAWLISAPLFAAFRGAELNAIDAAGIDVAAFGLAFEAIADGQLARFKRDPANAGKVMDRGLWRYTRHPNYFGEFCVWWGFWLIALAAGGAWTVFAPLLMTFLLLRVSGVSLLEKDIGERRPGYREYVRRTNAFFPGPPRHA
jgi:steroid 5-alpha reductase family enzyme